MSQERRKSRSKAAGKAQKGLLSGNDKAGETAGGATLGFESQLWAAANALRGSMDAAEYKHVVLGLIFLKYISDAFEKCRLC
jgi:type I restriction enzyme M protein